MSDSAPSDTIACPACQATLYTAGIPPGDWIRCSRCHASGMLGGPQNPHSSRLALFSAILGAVSLVGTFITGVPAILLGILALRQVRLSAGQRTGTAFAVTGIACGTLFSVLGGTCLLTVAVSLAYFRPTQDPVAVEQIVRDIAEVEFPEGIAPYEATAMPMGVSMVQAGLPRETPLADTGVRIFLMRYGPIQLAESQLNTHAVSQRWALHPIAVNGEDRLTMSIAGEERQIVRLTGTLGEVRYQQYLTAINTPQGPLLILLSTPQQPSPDVASLQIAMDEADVRRFFASIQLAQ